MITNVNVFHGVRQVVSDNAGRHTPRFIKTWKHVSKTSNNWLGKGSIVVKQYQLFTFMIKVNPIWKMHQQNDLFIKFNNEKF